MHASELSALDINEMEQIEGGVSKCEGVGWGAGLACGLSTAGIIGLALFGPSCVGLTVGALACNQ